MCKKILVLFLTLMISLSLFGCSRPFWDSDMDIYEKIHKYYSKMSSYSADLDFTVYSNKTENQYFVSQKAIPPDKFYTRVTDPKGTFSITTVTNGQLTKTNSDSSEYSLTVPSQEYLSLLFVNNFFNAYYSSEETSISVDSSAIKSDKTILDVFIPDNNLAIKKVSMSIDNKTLAPVSLTVYNSDQKVLISAKYENFKYNDKIDDSVFSID